MPTERVTTKHLNAGDVIAVDVAQTSGVRYQGDADRVAIERVDRGGRQAVVIYLADGTRVSAGYATKFTREVSA